MPGYIYAIAASVKSTDTDWFVKILERREANQPYTDSYGVTNTVGFLEDSSCLDIFYFLFSYYFIFDSWYLDIFR